jgi:hypothetical protein
MKRLVQQAPATPERENNANVPWTINNKNIEEIISSIQSRALFNPRTLWIDYNNPFLVKPTAIAFAPIKETFCLDAMYIIFFSCLITQIRKVLLCD